MESTDLNKSLLSFLNMHNKIDIKKKYAYYIFVILNEHVCTKKNWIFNILYFLCIAYI